MRATEFDTTASTRRQAEPTPRVSAIEILENEGQAEHTTDWPGIGIEPCRHERCFSEVRCGGRSTGGRKPSDPTFGPG